MKVVAGLGNPGKRYEASRHNLGFQVLDRIAARLGLGDWKSQFQALAARGQGASGPFLLVKPQTYMNLSGVSVMQILHYYHVPPEDCCVIVDEMDLPVGKIRMRAFGSDGGHLGLRSVIEHLGGPGVKRIRIGIGRPQAGRSAAGHVLAASAEEAEVLAAAVERAADLTIQYLETGRFENWSSP